MSQPSGKEPAVIPPFRRLAAVADFAAVAAFVAVGGVLGFAFAQSPAAPPESPAWRHAKLHVGYAEARLKLAEAKLEKAKQLNAASPGQVSSTDLRSLASRIDVLRDELADTDGHEHGYGFVAQRRAARAAAVMAEQHLDEGRAIHARRADAVSPIELRIRELRLEIARLRARIWEDPSFLASPTDVLQMQIDQLGDQLQDVLHGVDNAPALDRR
jgi:hypothetical protein